MIKNNNIIMRNLRFSNDVNRVKILTLIIIISEMKNIILVLKY